MGWLRGRGRTNAWGSFGPRADGELRLPRWPSGICFPGLPAPCGLVSRARAPPKRPDSRPASRRSRFIPSITTWSRGCFNGRSGSKPCVGSRAHPLPRLSAACALRPHAAASHRLLFRLIPPSHSRVGPCSCHGSQHARCSSHATKVIATSLPVPSLTGLFVFPASPWGAGAAPCCCQPPVCLLLITVPHPHELEAMELCCSKLLFSV